MSSHRAGAGCIAARAWVVAVWLLLSAGSAAAQQTPHAWSVDDEQKTERARPDGAAPLVPDATVVEAEPNDETTSANDVALGDTVSGVIGEFNDIDYFAIDLEAGTSVDFDVDAEVNGSALDAVLFLLDTDGFTELAFSDDANGLDSRIRGYEIPADGRYYLAIVDFYGEGGTDFTYSVALGEQQPGPGDPTVVRASGADAAWTVAAGATGEVYVLDWLDGDIWRVASTGSPSRLAGTLGYDMALDAFGDLLVVQPDSGNIMRVSTTTGTRSRFASLTDRIPLSIAVGPDGDAWVFAIGADFDGSAELHRFSPYGGTRDVIDASGVDVLRMAFSEAGELHLSDGGNTIRRLNADGTFSIVFRYDAGVGGMSFDTDGSMYVSTPGSGLLKVNSSYQIVADPFALANLNVSGNTAFLRSGTGAMTSRLVASNLNDGLLVEMNPAGISAPGIRVGTDLERVTISADAAAQHLLERTAPEGDVLLFLDGQGNGNGEFDVGDLRALTRAAASSSQSTSSTNR